MKQQVKSAARAILPRRSFSHLLYWNLKYQRHLTAKNRKRLSPFLGNEFECPFCGERFKELLPHGEDQAVLQEKNIVGGGRRLNALCPCCYSTDRERLLYLFLKHETNVFRDKIKLLHVAPEESLLLVFMKQANVDYLTVDLDDPLAMEVADLTNLQYNNNSFDFIICNHVLEHIPDDRKAMSELYRVLNVGGTAILQVPISLTLDKTYEDPAITTPQEREKAFGQYDHVRIYAKDYKTRLEAAGFCVNEYSLAEKFGEDVCRRYAINHNEHLFICTKPSKTPPPR